MENSLNNTSQTPDTANPQNASQSSGGSRAEDFQPAAEASNLGENTNELSVQQTGEPREGGTMVADGANYWAWGLIAVAVVIGVVWLAKLLIDDTAPESAPARSTSRSTSKSASQRTARKTTAKKKPAAKKKAPAKKAAKKRR